MQALVALLLGSAVFALAPAPFGPTAAEAGAYVTGSCGGDVTGFGAGTHYRVTSSTCFGGSGHLLAENTAGSSVAPGGSFAGWRYTAAPGNAIRHATWGGSFWKQTGGYWSGLFGNSKSEPIAICDAVGCNRGAGSADFGHKQTVHFGVTCTYASGCPRNGGTSGVSLPHFSLIVDDWSNPSLRDTGGALLDEGRWHRGFEQASFNASDNAGVREAYVRVGGITESANNLCDWTRSVPCANWTPGFISFNTDALPDGWHDLELGVRDAGYNTVTTHRRIAVDRTAPLPPRAPSVAGGEEWRSSNAFSVNWDNPSGQVAPIVRAHYRRCSATRPAEPCTTGVQSGTDIRSLAALSVPEPGDYTVEVHLEDKAGNAHAAAPSSPVHLRYDPVPPGKAAPEHANGWVGVAEAVGYEEAIKMATNEAIPMSGVRGYSVTTDGSAPDATVEAGGEEAIVTIADLREGVNTVRARAVSGAHVPSEAVGEATIAVDLTRPTVRAIAAPDPDLWLNTPASVSLAGTDQADLSGMAASSGDQPIEKGAYIAYRIDGGELEKARGDLAELTVAEDGEHTVEFQAYDLAGNPSTEREVTFKVDRTAPELVAFEAPDPQRPRSLSVVASDRTSGLGAGRIEIRLLGAAGNATAAQVGGTWEALPTRREGDRYVAVLDDAQLDPKAMYELRAVVSDVAGNETVSTRRTDGSVATVAGNVRAATVITTATGQTVVAQKRCTAKQKRTLRKLQRRARSRRLTAPQRRTLRRVKLLCKAKPPAPVQTVPFGREERLNGMLTTAEGAPIGDALVKVYEQVSTPGAEIRQVGELTTDRGGRFQYTASAGASRRVLFQYEGTETQRPTAGETTLRVAAASSIEVNRRRTRNGKSVVFSGRVLGGPIPGSGVKVDLQAFFRGKWRTFATPRTDTGGVWRQRYRFGATRGRVTYRFRALLKPEAGYPYEQGSSPTIKVTVRGR